MIDRVLNTCTTTSSNKDIDRHVKNLKTIYADKAKVEKASIWINGIEVKFGRDLNHTVRNINKFYFKAGVRASIKDSKLVLSTRSSILKIHDPKQILKNLVDKDRVGINKDHDIQIVRKGLGDAKFIYTFNNKNNDYRLDRDFSKSGAIYYTGWQNVHLQDPVDNSANAAVVQNLLHGQAPEPLFGVLMHEGINPVVQEAVGAIPIVQVDEVPDLVAQVNLEPVPVAVEVDVFPVPDVQEDVEPYEDENIDYLARAIELLNGKSKKETREILTDVAKRGNVNLIEAMVQIIKQPPANVVINKPGFVGMKRVYNDSRTYSQILLRREQSDDIKKACGIIADLAKISDHEQRVFHNLERGRYYGAAFGG